MDDLDFADMLYQGWSKTSHASDAFWGVEEDESFPGLFSIFAMDQENKKYPLAAFMAEEDAGWITAVHGCFGDLIKRWHDAIETAERMEIERDNVVAELGQAYLELDRPRGSTCSCTSHSPTSTTPTTSPASTSE